MYSFVKHNQLLIYKNEQQIKQTQRYIYVLKQIVSLDPVKKMNQEVYQTSDTLKMVIILFNQLIWKSWPLI